MAGKLPQVLGHPVYVGDESPGDDPAPQQESPLADETVWAFEGARAEGPRKHRQSDGDEQHVTADCELRVCGSANGARKLSNLLASRQDCRCQVPARDNAFRLISKTKAWHCTF